MEGLLTTADFGKNGLMSKTQARALGGNFLFNGSSGHKGKYLRLFSVGVYIGTHAVVGLNAYGANGIGRHFLVVLNIANYSPDTITHSGGKLISGSLSDYKFYVVGRYVYMYIPADAADGQIHVSCENCVQLTDGRDLYDSIATTKEIQIVQ